MHAPIQSGSPESRHNYLRKGASLPTPPWSMDPGGVRTALAAAGMLLALLVAATGGLLFDDTQRGLKGGLLLLMLALGAAASWWLWRLTRHALATARSLLDVARRVGGDELVSMLDSRRGLSSTPAASMLGDVASGVEHALSERERRWKARARLSADWYWETDRELRLSWVSEDLKSHVKLGLKPEDLIGRRHDEVPHYKPPEGGWEALNERMAQHKSFREVRIEVQRPGRSSLWIALSGKARRDPQGRFVGYDGVGRDITEQHLAFRRLHESERRYAVIADLSADWYWETDAEHRFTVLGPLVQDLLGDLGRQVLGRRRWEVHPRGATEEAWARHRADLAARRPFQGFEFLIERGQRGALWVSVSGVPRRDDKGQFIGYHGVGRDITLRKRAERVLLMRNAQLERLVAARTAELEQSNRDLDAFSRPLAHELRTPIGHVAAFADLLLARAAPRLTSEEREWLTLQGQSARAMATTVTALLELARSGSVAVEREAVDLSALACEVIAELPVFDRRAPVAWRIEPGLGAYCSAPLVRMVLTNLLANAAKFTRDIDAPQVAFCRSEDEGGCAVFVVGDNGAGFDEARGASLFQPFVRLHTTDQFQGTGVGLSIVRRLVERHGGWIRASGAVGLGARFEFTLGPPVGAAEEGENTDDVTPAAA
jgi:hypothetical protein